MNEKAHKEALVNARQECNTTENVERKHWLEKLFPELKESEDERIKQSIIADIKSRLKNCTHTLDNYYKEQLAWLEKQGEPKDYNSIDPHFGKPIDKVGPKFKTGQWIVWQDKCYKVNYNGCGYELVDQNGLSTSLEYGTVDENAHVLTIQDAKDGDELYSIDSNRPFIYKERKLNEQATAYCGLNIYGKFFVWGTKDCVITLSNYVPATKEQRDLLFQKMHEAGWEFDFDKKELKKISQRMISAEAKEAMYSKPTDLEVFINELSKQFPDVSFAKLSRIAVRVAKWANKPCWSEENKKHIIDIIDYLDDYYSFAKDEYEDVADGVLNEIRWLQSI